MGAELHDSIANDMNQIKRWSLWRILVCVHPLLEIDGDLLSARLRMAGLTSRAQPANTWFDIKQSWLHESDWVHLTLTLWPIHSITQTSR